MKKLLLALSFSITLFGCSSLEMEAVSTSAEETQRILAMGLSHEENLVEASKLNTPHMVSVVSLQLINARDEKIQAEVDFIEAENFSNMVKVSAGDSQFFGAQVSESIKTGILKTDIDLQNYHLEGVKD